VFLILVIKATARGSSSSIILPRPMPKQTIFEIRNVQVDGPYVLSHETVKDECGPAYDAWMERLTGLQTYRQDFPVFDAKAKPLESYVDVKFFRTNPTKDVTIVKLGTLYPSMCQSVIDYRTNAIGRTPALAYATGGSQYFHFLVYAGVVGAKEVVATGYPDFSDDSTLPSTRVTNAMKKLGDLMEYGPLPVIYNAGCGEAMLSFKRGDGGSNIIGVAMSIAKKCVNCLTVATPETAMCFKACGRCKAVTGISVWYCSKDCQVQDYSRHRRTCKETEALTTQKKKYIDAAAQGEPWAVCQLCGIKPTWQTVHMFHRCARCLKNGGHTVLYCSDRCQHADYPKHRPLCHTRLMAAETGGFVAEFVGHLDSVKETSPGVYERLNCEELRDELARAMEGAGMPLA